MEFGSIDGAGNGEVNGIDYCEISKIFATQDSFFYVVVLFDGVYHILNSPSHTNSTEIVVYVLA